MCGIMWRGVEDWRCGQRGYIDLFAGGGRSRFVVIVVDVVGGRGGVWREEFGLYEEPSGAVFPLAWGKVERGCKGALVLLSLTTDTASDTPSVRASEGAMTMSWCRGFRAGWL